MSDKIDRKNDLRNGLIVTLLFVLTWAFGYFVLTAGRGMDSVPFKEKFTLYVGMGLISVIGVVVGLLLNNFFNKRYVRFIIHEPEESPIGNLSVVKNPWALLIVSFLPFIFLFGFFKSSNKVFSGQITKFGNVWADAVLPAVNENFLVGFIVLGLVFTLFYYWFKGNKALFGFSKYVIIPILFGFIWLLFHMAVYGADEVSLVSVFVFGWLGFLMTMITMSCIPFLALHFMNNFLISLKNNGLMGNDWVFVAMLVFEVFLVVMLYFVLKANKRK